MEKMALFREQLANGAFLTDPQETQDIAARFQDGFSSLIQSKKREAVSQLLQDEFPHLVDNEHFVENVLKRLNDHAVEEQRYVFLVLNPNLKTESMVEQ